MSAIRLILGSLAGLSLCTSIVNAENYDFKERREVRTNVSSIIQVENCTKQTQYDSINKIYIPVYEVNYVKCQQFDQQLIGVKKMPWYKPNERTILSHSYSSRPLVLTARFKPSHAEIQDLGRGRGAVIPKGTTETADSILDIVLTEAFNHLALEQVSSRLRSECQRFISKAELQIVRANADCN